MAYKIKIDSKRQLKEPDEFISIMERAILFSKENTKYLFLVFAIISAVAVAYAVFFIKSGIDNEKAVKLEYDASRYHFGSGREKTGQDLKKAIEIYQKIVTDYKKSSTAPIANYYLGNAHMELKEYDDAIKAYRGFVERYPDRRDLIPLVYQRLAYAHLAKGDNQNALESFNRAANLELARNRDQSLFESGRILEVIGQKDEALKKYEEIVKDFPLSVYSAESQVKIKELSGDVKNKDMQMPKESKIDDNKNKKR